jgi:hypothetical protein
MLCPVELQENENELMYSPQNTFLFLFTPTNTGHFFVVLNPLLVPVPAVAG